MANDEKHRNNEPFIEISPADLDSADLSQTRGTGASHVQIEITSAELSATASFKETKLRVLEITPADLDAVDPLKERGLLIRFLTESGLPYIMKPDYISIPLVYNDPDLFEDGTRVELVAMWRENSISIEIPLLDLYEDELLDPFLMDLLLTANYDLYFCKFAQSPLGISLLVDFDARNLHFEEFETGVRSMLSAFELYLKILLVWFRFLANNGWSIDEKLDQVAIQELAAEPDKKEGQVARALLGIAKTGVTAVVLTGIASAVGVPAAGIGAILAAVAAGRSN